MSSEPRKILGLWSHLFFLHQHCCKDLTRVSGQVPITLKVSDSKGESPVVQKGLSSRGVPYERTTRGQRKSSARQDRRWTSELRFDVFKVEHKRTSLESTGRKVCPLYREHT